MHSPMFTLEVFPPKRNAPVDTIYDTLDGLEGLNPDFISVTYGHGTHSDRTATARIAHTISKEYGIPAVAHLTALYSDKAKIDEALDMFEQAGGTISDLTERLGTQGETAAQRVLDELILARVRVMTAPERTAFLAHVRDIVDSVEDNVTSVPVESVEPDDAKDTEEAE